ncbi:MAG: hypothetical protein ABSD11_17360 [Methylocella sp.]
MQVDKVYGVDCHGGNRGGTAGLRGIQGSRAGATLQSMRGHV